MKIFIKNFKGFKNVWESIETSREISVFWVSMCLCVYICMCTMCKCSTFSFGMQLCNIPLCRSQPLKHAALYFSSAKICSLWFHFCGLCMLWLPLIAAHNTHFCLSNGRLSLRSPCACGSPVFPWGATSSPHALLN